MGRYRLHKPLCIPQFVFILMLYTMFYVQLCYTVQIELNTYLLTYDRPSPMDGSCAGTEGRPGAA